jgi:hypothetical protein
MCILGFAGANSRPFVSGRDESSETPPYKKSSAPLRLCVSALNSLPCVSPLRLSPASLPVSPFPDKKLCYGTTRSVKRDHVRRQHRHRRVLRGRAIRRPGQDFQKYLIYNHAAGIGDPAPDRVRARRHGRADQRARHGNSGCRPRSRSRSSRCSTAASRPSSARRAPSAPAATSRRCRRSRCS